MKSNNSNSSDNAERQDIFHNESTKEFYVEKFWGQKVKCLN